ncbi:DUF4978 domain-containing protein [Bacteroides sp.]
MTRYGCLLVFLFMMTVVGGNASNAVTPVSYVDIAANSSHKLVLRVDGKPYHMTNIQVRLDKLRYAWGWDAKAREAIIKQAAEDGFNTVSIPIHWREVEPSKNRFDWTILDEYMALCREYGIKMEMLWFSWSSGGRIQYLDEGKKILRTPDYVCTTAGTSEFTVLRKTDPWTLDWYDTRLCERETYVLGEVMEHIAAWSEENGQSHTVIGVQLGNEPLGYGQNVPATDIIDYYHRVGSAVKNSRHVVWTRLNCVNGQYKERINANEALREGDGTNIDIVGIDVYGTNPLNVSQIVPYTGKNYRMIMESGAEVSQAAVYQMAALYGNTAYVHYDMCGPDGHGLYARDGTTGFKPLAHAEMVRTVNWLMKNNAADLAVNAQGYGLYVHNVEGNTATPSVGVEGVTFTPKTPSSQAISIRHSSTELVLVNTKGGTFSFPESLGVTEAAMGYFDSDNQWVDQGSVAFTSTSITPPVATTVRLLHQGEEETVPESVLQAEFAGYGDGATVSTAYSGMDGFACHGYIKTAANGYIEWTDVDGLDDDGRVLLGFRYATGKDAIDMQLSINGVLQNLTFPSSGSRAVYKLFLVPVQLENGVNNTVRLTATGDNLYVDELQIYPPGNDWTGLRQQNRNSVFRHPLIYPNPAENELFFDNPGEASVDIEIYGMSGRLLKKQTTISNKVDISDLAEGYYLISIDRETTLFEVVRR